MHAPDGYGQMVRSQEAFCSRQPFLTDNVWLQGMMGSGMMGAGMMGPGMYGGGMYGTGAYGGMGGMYGRGVSPGSSFPR